MHLFFRGVHRDAAYFTPHPPSTPIITIITAINIYIITNMIVITKKGAHHHDIRTKHHRKKPVVGDWKSA